MYIGIDVCIIQLNLIFCYKMRLKKIFCNYENS
nr:MAG TPA: hypothetical protein [Caudoviricetes sp.]